MGKQSEGAVTEGRMKNGRFAIGKQSERKKKKVKVKVKLKEEESIPATPRPIPLTSIPLAGRRGGTLWANSQR
jgi:hypothetical protein